MIKKIFKLSILLFILSCGNDKKVEAEIIQPKKEKIIKEFGFILNNYEVKKRYNRQRRFIWADSLKKMNFTIQKFSILLMK